MDDSGSSGSSSSDSSSSSGGNDTSYNDTASSEQTHVNERDEAAPGHEPPADMGESDGPDATSRHRVAGAREGAGAEASKPSSPGVIILQWLTYAFWGWTILSLMWLIYIVVANVMTMQDTSGMVPYAIAATLVLLPIAIVCDIFYLRHEPAKKHGAAMVVMVIHAVIFALFGIGVLITAALSLVQLLIGSAGEHPLLITWIITAFISAVVYLLTFLRTLNPFARLRLARWYWVVMGVLVGGFIIAGFVGPVAVARLTQDDRELETNIELVATEINAKTRDAGQLPKSLDEVELNDKQKDLVNKGLLSYVLEGAPERSYEGTSDDKPKPRYQLCATFKRQSPYYSPEYDRGSREYSSYVSASTHAAGKVCYKLEVEN